MTEEKKKAMKSLARTIYKQVYREFAFRVVPQNDALKNIDNRYYKIARRIINKHKALLTPKQNLLTRAAIIKALEKSLERCESYELEDMADVLLEAGKIARVK